ncbi:uncharacterized protein BX664DRAFT_383991 [Halteromyces radiatus]|uniref:uncharacterized protein n=1 Tax=Halteromyces radiatus TaxID=101107 RepID=UPI00221FC6FD|nr:uncharacterized protein BX664DRAFT_383991 [Halteromyces radiatus]KAI8097756.1 hypothetical protein BX664DRAFT_383991 [Halteromyces radiatus]
MTDTTNNEPKASDKLTSQVQELIRKAMEPVGNVTWLVYDIEQDQIHLNTLKVATRMPTVVTKMKEVEEGLEEKLGRLKKEQDKAIDLITQIADVYKQIFAVDLTVVRNEIEENLVAFGEKLSIDARDQISTQVKHISEQQAKFAIQQEKSLSDSNNKLTTQLNVLDDKHTKLKHYVENNTRGTEKAMSAFNSQKQHVDTFSNKLDSLRHRFEENDKIIQNKIEQMVNHVKEQQQKVDKLSTSLTDGMRTEIGSVQSDMKAYRESQLENKETMASLRSDWTMIKSQLEPLLKKLQESTSPPPLETAITTTNSTPSSSLSPDVEIGLLKTIMETQGTKLNELYQNVTTLMKNSEPSKETQTGKSITQPTMVPLPVRERLDKLEENVTHIFSKLAVLEPRLKLEYNELKKMVNTVNRGSTPVSDSTVKVGEKRERDDMDDSLEPRLEAMEENYQRLDLKLTSLIGFIHQFRNTVLNPGFPDTLENGLLEMEACLKNHEMFISYLVDPLSVSRTLGDLQQHLQKDEDDVYTSTITPAMLTVISKFVADETGKMLADQEETIVQQAKKIKAMEAEADKYISQEVEKQMAKYTAEHMDLKTRLLELEKKL